MRPVSGQTAPTCPNCVRLGAELDEALARIAELERKLGEFAALGQKQGEQISQLEREAGRQAAPFRVPESKRKPNPKPPGRKKGHPPSHRKPPPVVDEAVEAPLERCPDCGGPVHDLQPLDQIISGPQTVRQTSRR